MSEPLENRTGRSERRIPADTAEEVAPGVLRIMLPIGLPNLGHVNCYAMEDDRGIALIDPGLADGVSHSVLTERLEDVGFSIAKVHTAVITHSHFDHYGGVARLRAFETEHPVAVYGHRSFGDGWRDAYDSLLGDEDSSALETRTDAEVHEHLVDVMSRLRRNTPWGTQSETFPKDALRSWSKGINPVDTLRPPELSHVLDDGDRIELGGRSWEALHTPGHADDHLCLWNPDAGILFGGDHMLPTITPHISGMSAYDDPLGEFFGSLERIAELDGTTVVLPAHGDPFTAARDRALEIRQHHVGRLQRLREIGTEIGDQPVEAYMQLLFRERSWGTMAASETYAHLEWLRIHEGAIRTQEERIPSYRLG